MQHGDSARLRVHYFIFLGFHRVLVYTLNTKSTFCFFHTYCRTHNRIRYPRLTASGLKCKYVREVGTLDQYLWDNDWLCGLGMGIQHKDQGGIKVVGGCVLTNGFGLLWFVGLDFRR